MIERRLRDLDVAVDQLGLTAAEADGLAQLCHELSVNPRLRITLSDGSIPMAGRTQLATTLVGPRFGERVAKVLGLVAEIATSTADLETQLSRQTDRAVLRGAGDLAAVRTELASLVSTLRADPELASTLTDPAIELTARRGLVDQLFADKLSAPSLSLVRRAIESRRLVRRLDQLVELTAQVAGNELARITAAAPLNEQQTRLLTVELNRILGTTVDLLVEIDPQVLGGLHVQVGEQIIDGTIRTRLENARRQIG